MELKPCPFCGGEASLHNKGVYYWVECKKCGAQAKRYPVTRAAIEVWNRRHEPSNNPLTLDELRQMEGEPVWVVLPESNVSFWALLREEWMNGMCMSTREDESAYGAFDLYGKVWLAYRRRPEEV